MTIPSEKTGRIFWSVAAGAALTGSFDNTGLGFLAWFALAFLLFSVRDATVKEAVYLGLLAGFVHYATLLYWLVPTIHTYGELPMVLSVAALLLLAFYLALYIGFFAGVIAGVPVRPGFLLFTVPVFWVALEYLKSFLFSGFPWGLIGYSQYNYLHLIQSADIFGVYGVSFFLCVINAAIFVSVLYAKGLAWQGKRVGRTPAVGAVVVFTVMLGLNVGYGQYRINQIDRLVAGSETLRVSVVQGNIEQSMKWDEEYVHSTIERYVQLSGEAGNSNPSLVVWPETAMPFYFGQDRLLTDKVMNAISGKGSWLLTGSPSFEYDPATQVVTFFNSAYLVDPENRIMGVYDKVHLVPFGEYVPFGNWLPFVNRLVHSAGDFESGERGKIVSMERADLGIQICYEIIFPRLSAEMTRNGGNLIVNITNDAWFGNTSGPVQHFSMAVFRSVENRRALVRSANTGISAFVDPVGRVMQKTGLFETAHISQDVPVIEQNYSYYTKYTNLLPAACLAVAALMLAGTGIRRTRRNQGGK